MRLARARVSRPLSPGGETGEDGRERLTSRVKWNNQKAAAGGQDVVATPNCELH
jgi:hypothetical protein